MSEEPKSFDAVMQARQIAWRRKPGNVTCMEWGWQNGRQYEHILPREHWEQGLWPGMGTSPRYTSVAL